MSNPSAGAIAGKFTVISSIISITGCSASIGSIPSGTSIFLMISSIIPSSAQIYPSASLTSLLEAVTVTVHTLL